jgi:cardiolipin synthase
MNLPNLITIVRILIVPLIIWLIISGQFALAFLGLIVAGASDAADGFIAKRFGMSTTLGAYLDPIADKVMLVSIYVSLGILEIFQSWLVIAVVSRDFLIVGGLLLAWYLDRPMDIKPVFVSKANTAGQIVLAVAALGLLAVDRHDSDVIFWGGFAVVMLTAASGAIYLRDWLVHMANGGVHTPVETERRAADEGDKV